MSIENLSDHLERLEAALALLEMHRSNDPMDVTEDEQEESEVNIDINLYY